MIAQNVPKSLKIATKGSTPVAKRFHFTKRRIDALPSPTNGQRAYWYDDEVRGLAVAVTPLGKKSFLLYKKVAGRPERVTIGAYPDLSIEQARGQASQMNSVIAQGGNPAAERRAVDAEMTLQELFDSFLLLYAKERLRPATWKNYQSIFNNHLHPWRFRKLFEITDRDVSALHMRVGKASGPHIANRLSELLSAMFNRAKKKWGYTGANPAAGVEAFPEESRKRFLGDRDATEPTRFFNALAEQDQIWQDFFKMCVYTGARCGDVERMAWDEINFLRGLWTLSAETTKGKKTVDIALDPTALEILESRKGNSSKWVFPSPRRSQSGHISESKAAWTRILTAAKIENFRVHDLRHTLGAFLAAAGASELQIGKQLGHAPGSPATKVYSDFNLSAVRSFLNVATSAMVAASNEKLLKAASDGD
jgi:integrase